MPNITVTIKAVSELTDEEYKKLRPLDMILDDTIELVQSEFDEAFTYVDISVVDSNSSKGCGKVIYFADLLIGKGGNNNDK